MQGPAEEIIEEIKALQAEIAAMTNSMKSRTATAEARLLKLEQDMQADTEFMQKRTYELLKRSNRLHMLEFLC